MIVDACLFAGEAEMLDLRFRTLAPIVDQFVVVASSLTHQGQPADVEQFAHAYGTAARNLTRDWYRRSTLVWMTPTELLPPGERGGVGTPWYNQIERQHRNHAAAAAAALPDAAPDWLVMVSDVDEIPAPEAVARAAAWPDYRDGKAATLEMRFHSAALELLHPQQPWYGTTITHLAHCFPQAQRDARGSVGSPDQIITPIPDGGWHLSWFGTDDDRQRKLDTFSHAELRGRYDPAEGRRTLRHANGEPLRRIGLTEAYTMPWPRPLLDGSFTPPESWTAGWDDAR